MREKKNKEFKQDNSWTENNFQVPEGYFDYFNEKLMLKIHGGGTNHTSFQKKKTWKIIRPQLIFAASFIGLALIIYSFMHLILREQKVANPTNSYITEVIEFEINNIREEILFEMLESHSLNKVPENDMEEIIFEYLINTEIDYETIFNEL